MRLCCAPFATRFRQASSLSRIVQNPMQIKAKRAYWRRKRDGLSDACTRAMIMLGAFNDPQPFRPCRVIHSLCGRFVIIIACVLRFAHCADDATTKHRNKARNAMICPRRTYNSRMSSLVWGTHRRAPNQRFEPRQVCAPSENEIFNRTVFSHTGKHAASHVHRNFSVEMVLKNQRNIATHAI